MTMTGRVRGVMPAAPPYVVEVRAGTSFELLVGLSALTGDDVRPSWLPEKLAACPPGSRQAIDAIGARSGELWLHLLGVALEQEDGDAASLVAAVERLRPAELRRHLVGVFVPAWRTIVGVETLERAAAGDAAAAARLLESDRYYAGRAADALAGLLPLTAAETKRRVVAALRSFFDEVLAPVEPAVGQRLERDAEAKRALQSSLSPAELISAAAGGYRYEPEPGLGRVVLVPHLAAAPWLLLCQHEDARVICYAAEAEPADPEQALIDGALLVARALADEQRIRIVRLLAASDATAAELARHLGLTKSTTHHHLTQLREARLVVLKGNARGYSYSLADEALPKTVSAFAGLGL
jgi:DNA-binding transcriptional ArsR family regulator